MLQMEPSTAETWHTIVQWSSGIAQTEAAGESTDHREEPELDTYCCPRCGSAEARHETVHILGTDAHTRARLWYIVHDCSKSSQAIHQYSNEY